MNVAEIELLTPARAAAPAALSGREAAPAEPFERVLARRAAEDADARRAERPCGSRDNARSRATDDSAPPETPADAEPSEVEAADGSDAPATGDKATDDTDPEATADADDGRETAVAIGPGTACAEAPSAADTEACAPGATKASTPKATSATAADAKAEAATPAPAAPTTPAKAATPEPEAPAATATPASENADAEVTAKGAPVPPDASDGSDSADASDEGSSEPHRATARAHTAEKKAAPAAPAPDKLADTGLARAMQQAAAPAQAALARTAEAATARHSGNGEAHGGGAERADALGSTSATSDATSRVTGDLRAVRAEAARHAPAFDRVMDQTLRMVRVGPHEASVRLVPDHLGEVHVRVSMDRGHVVADLTAHNPVTRELLESHQARLQEALVDGGADGARVNVSLGGEPGREPHDDRPAPREADFTAPVAAETPKATAHAAPGPGGLSIRA